MQKEIWKLLQSSHYLLKAKVKKSIPVVYEYYTWFSSFVGSDIKLSCPRTKQANFTCVLTAPFPLLSTSKQNEMMRQWRAKVKSERSCCGNKGQRDIAISYLWARLNFELARRSFTQHTTLFSALPHVLLRRIIMSLTCQATQSLTICPPPLLLLY